MRKKRWKIEMENKLADPLQKNKKVNKQKGRESLNDPQLDLERLSKPDSDAEEEDMKLDPEQVEELIGKTSGSLCMKCVLLPCICVLTELEMKIEKIVKVKDNEKSNKDPQKFLSPPAGKSVEGGLPGWRNIPPKPEITLERLRGGDLGGGGRIMKS